MLIAGGRLVDPSQGIDALRDVRIRDGIVTEIGEHLCAQDGEEIVDAAECFVAPGFIDMHVHLREPGENEKETIATGTDAAAAGGFTAVACMPNTSPAIDTPETVRWIRDRAAGAAARVHVIAAITRGRNGDEPVDYQALGAAGAVGFSDDGSGIARDAVAWATADAAREYGALFLTHCEDARIKAEHWFDAGAEEAAVRRDTAIAGSTGLRWHIAHVSAARSLRSIRAAKAGGASLTCEATPHHLTFVQADVEHLGGRAKVNPPLREAHDRQALREAVRDGTVDALATDHAPHTLDEKTLPFAEALPGFTGLEIAVGAYAHALPDLPVARFVELVSTNPARILRVAGGTLAPGSHADVTIFADRAWTVDSAKFRSKGRVTPFAGMTLPRRAVATIVGGRLVRREEAGAR